MMRMRGAALLWVLWLLLLGSTLVALTANDTAQHYAYSSLTRRQSQSDAVAEAGLALAMWQVDSRSGLAEPWQPDGGVHRLRFSGHELEIRIQDESAKIDLNQSSAALMQRYLQVVGVSATDALVLAQAVVDYRDYDDVGQSGMASERAVFQSAGFPPPANRPFRAVAELRRIPGFTPDMYARIQNDLSVYSQRALPTRQGGSEAVRMALDLSGSVEHQSSLVGLSGLYRVQVRVAPQNGPVSGVTAVLQQTPFDPAGRGYRMLSWERTYAGTD